MRYLRRISFFWVLFWIIAVSDNSYAASRDSRATLHISVTVVSMIATGPTDLVDQTHLASSENQDIIYSLRPDLEQKVADAMISTSQPKAEQKARTNVNDLPRSDSVVELTTVVMK